MRANGIAQEVDEEDRAEEQIEEIQQFCDLGIVGNRFANGENGQRDDGDYRNEEVVCGDVPFVLDLQTRSPCRARPPAPAPK